ncbi:MAG: YkgJ family cysteine cluster protein [Thiotrichales bacterium]|nr:YkgJ family cysteine cluster protein [Thiotrichales bacterium]
MGSKNKDAKIIPIKPEMTSATKCGFCEGAKCCQYVTQEIDTPKSKKDFDHLMWTISHDNLQLYKDDDAWYLLITGKCAHLLPDGCCGTYETRPQICRDYTNDYCEYDQPAEEGFELYFRNDKELDKYCRKRFKTWDGRHEQWAKKEKKEKKAS